MAIEEPAACKPCLREQCPLHCPALEERLAMQGKSSVLSEVPKKVETLLQGNH